MQLRLPTTVFISFCDYGGTIGQSGGTDFVTTLLDAAEMMAEIDKNSDTPTRVFQIDLDVSTNLPESVRDVTDDCIEIIKTRWAAE